MCLYESHLMVVVVVVVIIVIIIVIVVINEFDKLSKNKFGNKNYENVAFMHNCYSNNRWSTRNNLRQILKHTLRESQEIHLYLKYENYLNDYCSHSQKTSFNTICSISS